MCGASAHVSLTPTPEEARSGHKLTAHKFLFRCNSFVTHPTLRWSHETGDSWVAPWFAVSLCGYTSPEKPDVLLGEAREVEVGDKRSFKTLEERLRRSNRHRILYKEDKNETGGDVLWASRIGKKEMFLSHKRNSRYCSWP